MKSLSAYVFAIAVACLQSCTDPDCTEKNLDDMLTCRVSFAEDVDFRSCYDLGAKENLQAFDARPLLKSKTLAACRAFSYGRLAKCIADKRAQCIESPQPVEIAMQCLTDSSTSGGDDVDACEGKCASKRKSCEEQCKNQKTFNSCIECASTCGLDYGYCRRKC